MQESKIYRSGVVGVFQDKQKRLLICERADRPGVWQFPQGGIEAGENERDAFVREMTEELGTADFVILKEGAEWTEYTFPDDAEFPLAKLFKGQRQKWFLCEFSEGGVPNFEISDHEFVDCRWVSPEESLQNIVTWKQNAYQRGLKILEITR